MDSNNNYPATLTIDYPDKLDRFSSFFRIIFIIPIFVIFALISGPGTSREVNDNVKYIYNAGGLIFLATVLMILFRQKYPKWWYDWNLALTKFSVRVFAYLLLLRSEYPSTDEEQAVHIEIPYPDVEKNLNRFLPLVKWFLAIPHYIVLAFLYVGVVFAVIIAWFVIVFTVKYPVGLFNFVVGVIRWSIRVDAYAFLLTTDKYPTFSLS
jgi:hypothetical protein